MSCSPAVAFAKSSCESFLLFVHLMNKKRRKMVYNMDSRIEKYCGNIEKRIRACHNREIAIALKKRLCQELDMNCKSDMVHNVLESYADKIIAKTFDRYGNNIYLERRDGI
jgi:hypothetical protein